MQGCWQAEEGAEQREAQQVPRGVMEAELGAHSPPKETGRKAGMGKGGERGVGVWPFQTRKGPWGPAPSPECSYDAPLGELGEGGEPSS